MKTNILKAFACASLIAGMTACDDAKDLLQVSSNVPMPLSVGTCADAKYLDDARAWNVNATGTPYENVRRIELTASGNYMFLPDMESFTFEDLEDEMFDAPRHKSLRKSAGKDTRSFGNYPAGTFTKTGDNEYQLSSLGKLTVNSDGTLTLNDGKSDYDFNATPVSAYQLNELTRRFSRTWEVVQVERAYYDADNKLIKRRFLSQEEIEDDYVRAVVITQYGAFVRYDWDNSLDGYGIWKWGIPEKQFFQFVFKDDEYYADNGYEQVYFYNDFAMYLEYGEEVNDDQYYEIVDVLKTRSTNDFAL